jgi:Ca2+-binding RTX toxin-like protein
MAIAGLGFVALGGAAGKAGAHELAAHADAQQPLTAEQPAAAGAVASCGVAPGLPFSPDVAVSGSFGADDQGSYLMVPFDVPAGSDAVRVRYCHDEPLLADPEGLNKHTLDLGLYEPESPTDSDSLWGEAEFRGWGGSSRPDTTVSGEAVEPESPDRGTTDTTVGYLPGPIPAGRWAAELGVAAIGDEGPTEDGEVQWRVEIDWIDDPAYSDQPYEPTPYDATPARDEPGWYAGDMHVHARHSNPNDSEMETVFDYAFCPDPSLGPRCEDPEATPGADLDFITLSDYVTIRQWDEIGRFQPDYPGHLVIRSSEVITYEGHTNNHASGDWADYRTGPIELAELDGSGEQTVSGTTALRPAIAPGAAGGIFDQVHEAGGWTQINHPTIFPSAVPIFQRLCRGCPWDYSAAETDYGKVDAIEVATGPAGIQDAPVQPGPNPFTPTAIQFYEQAIDADGLNSNHIAAVGASDSHKAGGSSPTTSPIGQATTVVYADELSEDAIQRGVEAGHTYVKIWGNDGPDLRFTATSPETGETGIMGDTVEGDGTEFSATVKNLEQARAARAGSYTLYVIRNGLPLLAFPIPPSGDEFSVDFPSVGPGRYRLQVERELTGAASIENVSSPIWTTGAAPPDDPDPGPGPNRPKSCSEPTFGTAAPDELRGTQGPDAIAGRDGDDTIRGFGGKDCLLGEGGADRLRGGPGADDLFGGRGADRLRGSRGRDRLDAGSGGDVVNALGGGRDKVRCGGGDDRAIVGPNDEVSGCEVVRRRGQVV